MKLENQVCTLEQAKRLVALGVYCPSVFVYFTTGVHSGIALGNMYMRHIWILTGNAYEEKEVNITPAYTVAELGEMLPPEYCSIRCETHGAIGWESWQRGGLLPLIAFATEAECRATLLIRLIESKLITVEQINKRITQ